MWFSYLKSAIFVVLTVRHYFTSQIAFFFCESLFIINYIYLVGFLVLFFFRFLTDDAKCQLPLTFEMLHLYCNEVGQIKLAIFVFTFSYIPHDFTQSQLLESAWTFRLALLLFIFLSLDNLMIFIFRRFEIVFLRVFAVVSVLLFILFIFLWKWCERFTNF